MIPTSFANPLWFWALWVPALMALWESLRRPHTLALPFDHGEQASGVWLARTLRGAAFLPPLLLAVAVVLLAGPQRPGQPDEERVLTNIEFVLDVSGSMESPFGDKTRFDGALGAIQDFTTHRKGDAFGLTIFGNEVLHWTPLTKDLEAIRSATPFLRPSRMPPQFGGTEIGKALRTSLVRVRRRGHGAIMVLVSDGQSADLGNNAARTVGQELAMGEVMLYAIHIGDGAAPRDLYDLTRPSGGEVFAVKNPAALDTVFGHIDRMQPIRMRPKASLPIDALRFPGTVALVLLGLHQLASFGLRYTPW